MVDIQLTENFRLSEFVATSHPDLQSKVLPHFVVLNLYSLCRFVLQPLRNRLNRPVFINSGFRSPELNKAVCGSSHSYHLDGRAADIHCVSVAEWNEIYDILSSFKTSELIKEEKQNGVRWIHVAF